MSHAGEFDDDRDGAVPWRLRRVLTSATGGLARQALAERERWPLWIPALLGCGIGLYFMLLAEPPWWTAIVAVAVAAVLLVVGRGRDAVLLPAVGILLVALGFAAAQLQTWRVAAPVLATQIGPVFVDGRVVEVDPLPDGKRVVVAPQRVQHLAAAKLPALLRIKVTRGGDEVLPGDRIAVRAILYPPPEPAMPGAYDFQRRAYFDRIGGVGFAVAPVQRRPPRDGDGPARWQTAVAALRIAMTERIVAVLPGRTGGVAAAIITGQTHAIPEVDAAAFRDAGLAHILVIAGLHMGLVAGLAFVGLRAFFALIPAIALRYPTKKWAAGLALLVTFAYMLLSGATVSSRRSFVMTGLVMLAVLVDRLQLSARGLAYAATAILLLAPMSLTGPSFQMSFAAVGALIAFYETYRSRLGAWRRDAGPVGRAALYALGIALTTVICTVATAPYTVFHFNRFAVYSVAANIIAVPITGFWVMPWAMVSCALMPLGLERLGLIPMGWGIDAITAVAHGVTSWPGSVVVLPAMPLAGLLAVTVGGLWLCIWQRRWRLLGVPPIVAGIAAILIVRTPDLVVDGGGKQIAVLAPDGRYLIAGKQAGMTVDTWTRRGAVEIGAAFPKEGATPDGALACDRTSCIYQAHGRSVALLRAGSVPADACTNDLVVGGPVAPPCDTPARVIAAAELRRRGTHVVWLDRDAITIETVADWRGARPWIPPPVAEATAPRPPPPRARRPAAPRGDEPRLSSAQP
ncbi:MAG: ComEC [Rhodospirillales bacterium]|nr:ComEC [Rhodospirillales bacterium]